MEKINRGTAGKCRFRPSWVIGQWVRTQDFRELKTEKTEIAPDMT